MKKIEQLQREILRRAFEDFKRKNPKKNLDKCELRFEYAGELDLDMRAIAWFTDEFGIRAIAWTGTTEKEGEWVDENGEVFANESEKDFAEDCAIAMGYGIV